jgi:putative ABC transport system permease protein
MSGSPASSTLNPLRTYELSSGNAPAGDDEIVIDKASAVKSGYAPGDVATVLTRGEPQQFTIVGVAWFGSADSPAGATAVLFTDAAAERLLAAPNQADAIAVTADEGLSQDTVAARIRAAIGDDVEVITGATLVAEDRPRWRRTSRPSTRCC